MGIRRAIATIVIVAAGFTTSQAEAANRYAAPAGSNSAPCTLSDPCSLQEAVINSSSGDDITVLSGSYSVPGASLAVFRENLTIHGPATGQRPVITATGGNALYLLGDGNVVRDLSIVLAGTTTDSGLFVGGSSPTSTLVERVHVLTTAAGSTACAAYLATIRDSVCETNGAGTTALRTTSDGTTITYARNVTAVARGSGSTGIKVTSSGSAPGNVQLDARNVIASGGFDDVSSLPGAGGPSTTLNLSTSIYDSSYASAGGTMTPAGAGTNISADPAFVSAAAGDFRLLPTSPGIDAGFTDSRTGTTDFTGADRVQGGRIDIGAFETTPAASPPASDVTAPETAFLSTPSRKTRSKRARFDFDSSEPGSTFECALDGRAFRPCAPPVLLRRVKPRRHVYEVRSVDAAGNVDATPATYRWKVRKKPKRR